MINDVVGLKSTILFSIFPISFVYCSFQKLPSFGLIGYLLEFRFNYSLALYDSSRDLAVSWDYDLCP